MENTSNQSPVSENEINRKSVILLGVLYFIALIWIVIFKCNNNEFLFVEMNRKYSLWERMIVSLSKPVFWDLYWDISTGGFVELLANIFNLIGFIPLGMVYRFFYKRSKATLLSFITVIGIEAFQLFTGYGGLAWEDLVTNTLGAFIGIILFEKLIHRINPGLINKIAQVLIYVMIPLDTFFVINTIIHFPG